MLFRIQVLNTMLVGLTTVMAMKMVSAEGRDPVLHRVGGGRYSWAPHVNFTQWATNQTFYVGDWLYFGFDRYRYNVLEVNKSSYENCYERNFMKNITRGGRDVFNLTEAKPYYFICGHGYCFQGMKVAVYVRYAPSDTMPPVFRTSPPSSRAPTVTLPLFATAVSLIISFFKFQESYI
ncbi:hypothetical protein Tsubulata_001827 [Turnera subulata]|uniref:Phytocyanin domain-containing protein n=1 Tax=Turnera subulata TaxID=218843 RepID=A0A9Q0G3D3_9ROSI|nr:hypothetical protein Tsubulata_001827 [Turnera subulata]